MPVREMTRADADAVAALLIRSITELCIADHRGDAEAIARWTANKTPANVRRWMAAPGMIALVATDHGALTGVAMASAEGVVHLIYVHPAHRFGGVSDRLLAAIETRLADMGVATATLESTKTAWRFYLARGWRPDGDRLVKALR